jgi:6-phosphogluconolactonase
VNELRVFEDLAALSAAAADAFAAHAVASVAARGSFTVALSGGNTPRALYTQLAARPSLPWPQTELWFGDERAVPSDDPASNAGMVHDTLSAQPFVPARNVQRIASELPLAQAASDYERRLRQRFAGDGAFPRFDLVLLGLGADGHTASLFPHARALAESRAWVTTHAPPHAPARITLTLPVLNNARAVLFLIAGADKAEALRRTLDRHGNPAEVPARAIAPVAGTLSFFVDRAATGPLTARGP